MRRLPIIFMLVCCWTMPRIGMARASDDTPSSVTSGTDDQAAKSKIPAVAKPPARARSGTLSTTIMPSHKRDGIPRETSRPHEAQASDAQAQAVTAAATGMLPGLPSPMVAVVDPMDAAAMHARTAISQNVVPQRMKSGSSGSQSARAASDVITENSPVSIAASVTSAGQKGSAELFLPFDQHVGAAAFRRGSLLFVVFDSGKPVDLAPVAGDPVFGAASYSLLSSGAMMTLPLRADMDIDVERKPDGWSIKVAGSIHPRRAIEPDAGMHDVSLPVADPGYVVVVNDPILKVDLLVGTVRQDHQNVPLSHHTIGYVLDPTLLGVVVERLADPLEMRPTSGSFTIEQAHGGSLRQDGHIPSSRMSFSRILDLPPVDDAELERRYRTALTTAASKPLADRRLSRLNAAEAALALGQAREAGQLAAVADQDAPSGPQPGRSAFLQAAAAVLDRKPEAATLLEDPRIPNGDEVTMWRALDLARRDRGNADAARTISRFLPLIEGYPAHLREMLLGDAAISLATAGGPHEAAQVRNLRGDGKVRLAQAMAALQDGDAAAALAGLDALAADTDPAINFVAAEKAVELRLKLGRIKPQQAADRLDAEVLNARMAGEEPSLKLRIASLRAQAADWPAALGILREVATSPTMSRQVEQVAADVLERMAAPGGSVASRPDITRLGMIQGNLDLLPTGAERTKISIALARQLVELDLPERAAALVQDALAQAPSGLERAQLGLQLARLHMSQADAVGTIAALDATDVADLPVGLSDARTLMRARAEAAAGQVDTALATLAPLQGPEADELRASELAKRQDWKGQAAVLASLVAHEVPAAGRLSGPMEDLVLRLVAATARAGDQGALRQLALGWSSRFSTQSKLDMLRLLTSDGVKDEADLPRSAAELPVSRSALSALSIPPGRVGG